MRVKRSLLHYSAGKVPPGLCQDGFRAANGTFFLPAFFAKA
jgi:hypothetical protein